MTVSHPRRRAGAMAVLALAASAPSHAVFLNLDVIPDGTLDPVETATVQVGEVFDVNVVVGEVLDLAGFEFVLNFDATKVTPLPAGPDVFASADVFAPAGFPIINEPGPGAGQVQFAEVSLGPGLNLSSAVLGTISFQAIAPTNPPFTMQLTDILLSDGSPVPMPITPVDTNTGSVTVVPAAPGTAPLPGTFALLAAGLAALGLRRRPPRGGMTRFT